MKIPPRQIFWLSGLSGSGKSTICQAVASQLREAGYPVQILDGDEMRSTLSADLGFSLPDRTANLDRLSFIANLLAGHGVVVLVAAITPLESMRARIRSQLAGVVEIFVSAPLHVCESRDPKGLYGQARAGLLSNFTGISSPFEPHSNPHVICDTSCESVEDSAQKVLSLVKPSPYPRVGLTTLRRPTIAVDFDGVIAEYNGWMGSRILGDPRPDVLQALSTLHAEGWKIIVHTSRAADDIRSYLEQHNVMHDEINSNSDYPNCGKPVATVYWDDRALKYSGHALDDLTTIRQFLTWNGRQ